MNKAKAFFALLIANFFWASAYIFVKQLLETLSPYMILSLRFLFSCILLIIIYRKKILNIDKYTLRAGIVMGIFLFLEFFTFTVGLQYTTTSRSSLIIASYIVILPFAYLLVMKKRPYFPDIGVSVMCMIGVFFIVDNDFGSFHLGDIYCILCAITYAIYIVFSSKYSGLYDAGLLNVVQITVTALLSLASLFIMGDIRLNLNFTESMGLIYLILFCTTLPFFLILYGMKYLSATTAGILLSFESVMAAFMGVVLLHETFTWNLFIGGTIILFSFILSEISQFFYKK